MLTKLGKYQIKSELGHGGMGVVYRAEDTLLERPVALKTMSSRVAEDGELVARFYREARSAGKLRHPNIVIIYEIDQTDGTHFIAMEFLEGETLEQIIAARKDLPVVKKLDIIIQACRGLHYAHQHGIVHRDVKPGNIMVLEDGLVKIVDFGIAHITARTAITQDGVKLGTPFYMSPEHFGGPTVDARADIFSLGVLLYELLAYRKPFAGEDLRSLWFKVVNENPEPLTRVLPDCPPQLEKIVMKALAKKREERYQTAEDMAFDLQQVRDLLKRERVEVYVKEGRRSMEAGNLTFAKESFQKVLEIDSSHDLAKSLLEQVEEKIDTRRRTQKIDQSIRQAKEALQAGEFDKAIALLDEILQLSPEHEAAREYKRMAIERRDRTRKMSYHMARAEKLAADADLEAAKAELEAVLALDRKHSAALGMMDWLLKELTAREHQSQVSQCTRDARTYLAQKNFAQAMESLEKALELDPTNIEVEALMRQVHVNQEQETRKRLLEKRLAVVQDALNGEEPDHALTLADQALQEFPDDPRLLKLHAQASRVAEEQKKRRQIEEQLETARGFFKKNQYSDAVAVLQTALETVPDDARLASFLKTVEEAQERATVETVCRQAVRDANELIRAKNFVLAIETLERAQVRVRDSPELRDLLQLAREQQAERQRQERVRQVLNRARTFQRDENHEEAMRVLEQGQRELGGSEIDNQLAALREQWQKFEQRRDETLERARQLLEVSEPAKAVALLEAAPKAYFKYEQFQRLYVQSREALKRNNAVRSAAEQIEESISSDNLDQAEALLGQALTTYPNDPALLAAQQRLQEEQLRWRRMQAGKLVDEAKVAIGRMEYRRGIEILNSLPQELRGDPKLSSEVQVLLEQAGRSEERLGVRQQAIRDANARIRGKDFSGAIGILEQALAVAGQSSELADLLQSARTRRDAQRQERVHQVIDRAHSYLEADNYEETVRLLEGAQRELGAKEISKELTTVREQQQKFEEHREETLKRARQLLEAGGAAEAVALLEAAPRSYCKDDQFQSFYAQCREAAARASFLRAALDHIERLIDTKDLAEAATLLQGALGTYPDEPSLLGAQKRLEEEQIRLRHIKWARLVDEAKADIRRKQYKRAIEILSSLTPALAAAPQLASEVNALLHEARRAEQELALRQTRVVEPAHLPLESVAAPKKANHLRAVVGATVGVVILILVAYGISHHGSSAEGRPVGHVQLNAVPWAEVLNVQTTAGKGLNVTGQTPMEVDLPPGKYVIELKSEKGVGRVDVVVESGKISAVNYNSPDENVDEMVDELVSKY